MHLLPRRVLLFSWRKAGSKGSERYRSQNFVSTLLCTCRFYVLYYLVPGNCITTNVTIDDPSASWFPFNVHERHVWPTGMKLIAVPLLFIGLCSMLCVKVNSSGVAVQFFCWSWLMEWNTVCNYESKSLEYSVLRPKTFNMSSCLLKMV